MATIKAYSDLEQSRKLAKILPLESADMQWFLEEDYGIVQIKEGLQDWGGDCTVPCWSLASLLDVLPNGIVMNKDSQNGRYHFSFKYIETYVSADNPVDACYELILMLNELKML